MTILIKAGTGLVAGMVAGALGLAFLPRFEPNAVKPRSAVEMPQFVVASPAATLAGSEPRAAAVVAVSAETPEAKLVAEIKPTPEVKPAPVEPPKVAAVAPVVAKLEPPKPVATTPAAAVKVDPLKLVAAPVVAKADPPKPAATPPAAAAEPATLAAGARAPAVSDAAARWSVQGLVALAKGDLSSARLYLTRAAEAGDARAWLALADTYDPAMLTKLGVVIAPGDAQRAKDCLQKAAAGGVVVAKDRMAALDQATSGNLR